ncbi:MAG: polysaccharide deacetylase family protein [Coriobacteriia bacterium]|nr:polysaccharide deacetylase family protein [Coriobacteriia bacterium]
MGSYIVTPPRSEVAPSRLYMSVAALVAAALVAVAMPSYQAEVTVAGESYPIAMGATVADLADEAILAPLSGDLLDVTGEVLEEGAGGPAVYFVNGKAVLASERLRDGDRISARRGGDRIEATELVEVPIPIELERVGKGPLVSLESPGAVGVRQDTVGAISAKVVSTRVLEPAEPMVVRRWVPDPSSKVVALTFDDGPWPTQTEQVLDILAEADVTANFFMVGYLAERYPDIARRVADEGHLIGNHTQDHTILSRQSAEVTREQIATGSQTLEAVTGAAPVWFRPPGGGMNTSVLREAKRAGMDLVMWDVDPQDWRRPGVEPMLEKLLADIGPGSVVLLHDGGGNRSQTIEMLPRLIEELKEQGYLFVTLDQFS